jgi:hypothetical protein
MNTWVLAITLFGLDGHEPWRHVKVPGLTEVACVELLARVATANPKGKGLARCYNEADGWRGTEAMPSAAFAGK